ncbi:hypothetical protein GCM10009092_45790 [Bowmanella denitrificans]|uniref:Response regulatory domain-containing protein n=1 Tax=Bowmanella denitrificans TaxID=366582 RepID=A0ABP3HPR7_9ALTE
MTEPKALHLLLYSTNVKDDELLLRVFKQSELIYEITNSKAKLVDKLKDGVNKLILLATPSLESSLKLYYQCLLEVPDEELCRHAFLVVCAKHEEMQAFNYFQSRVIDDYIVARPLYELHRPITICYAQLEKLGINLHKANLDVPLQPQAQDDISIDVVQEGAERKRKLRGEFESLLDQFDQAIAQADAHLSKEQVSDEDVRLLRLLLQELQQNSFRPNLIRLQHRTLHLLDALLLKLAVPEAVTDVAEEPEPEPEPDTKPQPPSLQINEEARASRILMVEDDNLAAMMGKKLIEGMGLSFEWAPTGRRALALLQAKKFELILMDINLPDTDGLLIADQLPNMHCINSDTVIAVLTGNKQKSMVQRAVKAGAKHYLIKPLQKDTLVKLCSKYHLRAHH